MPVPGSPFAAGDQSLSQWPWIATASMSTWQTMAPTTSLSAYSIGANGALTPVPGSPFTAGIEPFSVAVDPMGKLRLRGKRAGNNVSAYSIGANGASVAGPRVALRSGGRCPSQWPWIQRASSYTWQTGPAARLSLQHRWQRSPETGPRVALRSGEQPRLNRTGSNG